MDKKTAGIVAYLWWVGLIIVLIMRKEKYSYVSFHIRQSLGLLLLQLANMAIVPRLPGFGGFLAWAINIVILVFWVMAIIGAFNEEEKPVPLVGEYFQKWFKGI